MVAMGDNPAAKIAQMGYTYQKFGHNWVQFTGELWGPQFKPQNGKAVAWMLLSPGVLGGMASMAALTPAWMLGTAILAALGDDRDPEKFVYDHLREMLGERGEEIARYGAFGAMGLDISGSLGIRVGVPTNIKDLTGPFGGVWDDVNQAFRYFRAGQTGRAAEQMLPALLRYPAKAIRELDGATTSRGNKIFDKHGNPYIPGTAESVLQAFGARSSRRAAIQARGWETKKQAYSFKNKKQIIYEEYKAYLFKPEPKKLKRIADKIDDFNRAVVEGRIEGITPITRKSLQSVIRHWNK